MDAGMLCEVDLTPSLGLAQLSDLSSEKYTNVTCHPSRMELASTLDLVYALSASDPSLGDARDGVARCVSVAHGFAAMCE